MATPQAAVVQALRMRRYWSTILMAIALAGLGGYVYFVELPAERAQTETEAREKKIVPFEEREINGLTLRWRSGEVALAPQSGTWKITAPLQTEADSREVQNLIRALVLGRVTRVVEEKATTLTPFGLDPPSVTLTVKADGRQETLLIGDSGPISSTLYAMRESDRKVLLTDLGAKDFLNKSLFTFRKKEILTIEQTKVDRLRLTYPKTEIVLYRVDDKGEKKKWTIRYPIEAPADQPAVRSLLFKLEDLKALGFIDPGPERDALAKRLIEPEIKVAVHLAGSDHGAGTEQVVKLFRPDPASGEAFAMTTPEAPIYRVSPTALSELTKDLFALQDKRLLGMERDDVTKLAVKTRDEEYTLVRQNSVWVLEDQPNEQLDQQKVNLFVSRVVDLPAELRIVKRVGPLAPYGLSTPSLEITAVGPQGKTGRLVLGTRTGGLVYAMGHGLPGIYQARADLLTQVPSRKELLSTAPKSSS